MAEYISKYNLLIIKHLYFDYNSNIHNQPAIYFEFANYEQHSSIEN